ncbi:hypothetical protein FSP39_004082 [Pinctada imbricata]|uniref:Sine oculis-binding protein homolog n=1 Tax=Pinctada imbricata TaxID=66713 RepID=A0AA88Y302_PINIB|nr:hypothetical protein FSP39_004082 [Pinctada imbricata]
MERDKIVDREKEGAEEGEEEKEKEGGSKSAVLRKDLPAKIKEEPRDEILKDYAENTMNELLGLYGYDKVINSSDTENLNLDRYTSTSTPIEGRFSLTDDEARDDVSLDSCDSSSGKSDQSKYGRSRSNSESNLAAQHRNLVTALTKKHGLTGVPEGTLPSGYVVCAWCQKPGGKNFTLKTEEKKTKTFCSEVCFTQCRRASFKKNKICDWCKHVRHTVNYVDFQDGETQLQFCSSKCLNQYKMNIFCKETQEHLQQIQSPGENIRDTASPNKILITPDLWLKNGRAEKREHGDDDGDEKQSSKSAKKEKETDVPKVELDNHETSSVHEGDRMSIMNRKVLNNAYRERSRKSLRRESPTRPTSQNSEVRAIPSPCPSNPNMAALNSWLSPHMWGSFGMAPMGALPPWYYPGLLPPGCPQVYCRHRQIM